MVDIHPVDQILPMLQDIGIVLHHGLHQDLHKVEQRPILDLLMQLDQTSGDQRANRSSWLGKARGRCLVLRIARRHEDEYALEGLMERGDS